MRVPIIRCAFFEGVATLVATIRGAFFRYLL